MARKLLVDYDKRTLTLDGKTYTLLMPDAQDVDCWPLLYPCGGVGFVICSYRSEDPAYQIQYVMAEAAAKILKYKDTP